MPPKKNVDKTSGPAEPAKEKVPLKKKVKEKVVKPKLKIPTVIKLKIPLNKTFVFPEEGKQEGKNKKNKGNDCPNAVTRKIELANEVALAQLTKDGARELEEKVKNEEPARRGRPKKDRTSSNVQNGAQDAKKGKVAVELKRPISNKDSNAPPKKRVRKNKSSNENDTLKPDAHSTSKQASRRRSTRIKASVVPPISESPEKKQIDSPIKGMIKDISTSETSASILKEASNILVNGNQKASESKDPQQVDSRKTSTSECLSWTKDISSSSTTSCLTVGTNDFVRFDKKIPQIRIPNIGEEYMRMRKMNDSESEKSSSSSSGSSSSSSDSSSSTSAPAAARELDLSAPSLSPSKQSYTHDDDDDDLTYAFQKLTAKLKRIDLEAISWIGYENQIINTKVDAIQDKIITLLTEENEVIECCRKIKEIFGVEEARDAKENENVVAQDVNNFIERSEEDENFTSPKGRNVMLNQNCENNEEVLQAPKDYKVLDEENPLDKVKYFEQPFNNDDCEDTLSLYAESITAFTGFDSSQINSSANSICANASEFEEYIPQPMAPRKQMEAPRYIPTKIKDSSPCFQNKSKTVCEKQNADSTSISKEIENCQNPKLQPEENEAKQSSQNVISQTVIRPTYKVPPPPSEFKKPTNSSASNPPIHRHKSVVFKGVCFFNLMLSCNKIHCQYPHHFLDGSEVSNRLSDLKNDMFVHEYTLLNYWPELRRRYGLCYVNECIRRKMSRLLVEMSIHFWKARGGVDDTSLKIHIIERTLLYLNNIDLHTCEDLLRTKVNDVYLCDIYMDIIAVTQNFSRFKVVFVKLVDLMIGIGRKFNLNVAVQILERVCILRCEKPIFEAMVKILENTDEEILHNPMMKQFEEHLSVLSPELYSRFFGVKITLNSSAGEGRSLSPRLGPDLDQRMLHTEREQRYTSPDTTKVDMNKSIEDPMPQTVKIIRPSIYNHLFKLNSNLTPDNREKQRFKRWRGKFRGHMNNGPYVPRGGMRAPMRPPMLNRRVQHNLSFGVSPAKYPRMQPPGPDYY